MKAEITEECIACERCVEICPAVFQMGDEYAEVQENPISEQYESDVRQAAEECPTSAIIIKE